MLDCVCIFLCMGYVTPMRLRLLYCPGKWSTNEMARSNSTFLKVNQGDIGFGHLENIASWKHLDNFSTLSDRNQFFTLCTFFFNLLIFPASVKLVPYMRRSFGKTTCDDAVWTWDSSLWRILFTSFVLQVSVMRTKWFWSLSELIINREWIEGLYFLKLVLSQYNKRKLLSRFKPTCVPGQICIKENVS